ncbi:restriction endonuclease subunit S [Enterococcus faecium]|uniref:restriction endonuclease subunit S n=1 Tax=Enterococcus faecium TaxID=1352 RepID=UPI00163AC9DC|nr:restriction endonuclease subunit S [Enterococcus faecium]HAR1999997.1 restriction endonuclease subunit S [Enterococcus faecium]HBH6112265.1 restriction endonuclease subunit S [Enterococcus faecium]
MSNDTRPEIRFPGFTDDWEQRKLSDILILIGGNAFSSSDSTTEGIPWLKIANVDKNGIDWSTQSFLPSEYWGEFPNYQLNKGDYVMALTRPILNHTLKIGKVDKPALLNQRVAKLDFSLDKEFTFQLLQRRTVVDKIDNELAGTDPPNLGSKNLTNIDILITNNKGEQQKIGTFFKQLDNIIALHQRKLDLLKETKKGFLQKMFPKNGAKVPEIRFPGFTEDWEQRKVGEIFKVTRGQVLAATETSESITEKNIYPVYSSQTKNDGLMGYYSDYLFDTAITWTTDGANAGTVNYRNGKFYSTNVNGVLLSDKGYANKAVAEIINRIAWKHVSKVGNPKLMNNVMSEIIITIPSVEEQETISRFFTQLDSTITLHERELDLLKETKKGFLQKMFV